MGNDIFVLVLRLTKYDESNVLEKDICGRTVLDWVKYNVSPWPHKFVDTTIDNDIVTILRDNIADAKYTVVTYADMPLFSKESIEQAAEYIKAKNIPALALPRGWVLDTEFVRSRDDFNAEHFANVNPDDYAVAFNDIQVAKIRPLMQERINNNHIKNGVDIMSPLNTYIDCNVKIGKNTAVLPGTYISNSTVGEDCQIGPYAHIRPESQIGNGCKIGNFVEIKRSVIGDKTKVAHMTYIGDGVVGKNCNMGCGVVFCNYDGKQKHTATIGDNVFVGSNTCIIAPVHIGDNAFIAAGSVITDAVPKNALAIARARQAVKENYFTENSCE
jgi:bifunctional N-acetylglucosamine-1-phosphate-uridyltransferase/glucosamine-1-phosphate-acetyltransferase GlmU-like protein